MQVLNRKESSMLLSVLTGGPARTLASVAEAFAVQFPKETARFRASCALGILLSEPATGLSHSERMLALFCLLSQGKKYQGGSGKANSSGTVNSQSNVDQQGNQSQGHPFERLVLDIVLNGDLCGEVERELVFQWLLEGKTPGLGKETGTSIESFCNQAKALPEARRKKVAIGLRRIQLGGEVSDAMDMPGEHGFGCFARAGVGRALVDNGTNTAKVDHSLVGSSAELGGSLPTQLGFTGFEPVFVRPSPPVMPPLDDEMFWITPSPPRDLVWDCGMGNKASNDTEVHKLIKQALEGPLMPSQQKQVLHELLMEPKLAYSSGLTPESLPKLVENTPAIAYEILLRLTNSNLINDYLQVLVQMNMSLHSMEVVNRLASAVNLPEEFVHCYISNCIASCNNVEDRYMQSRLVRLVCVFLQSLIKNGIINMQDLVHEVQAFCIDHSRIREAASLFRLLKQMEMGGGSVGVPEEGNSAASHQ